MTDSLHAPAATEHARSASAAANGHSAGVLQQHELAFELDGLKHRLATQPVIEQSKGILMGQFGIGPDTAFDLLRRWSSHTHLKVRDISQLLVATAVPDLPTDPRRANRELTDLINRLEKGLIPTSTA